MKDTCEIIDVFLLILSVLGQSTAALLEEPGWWISAVARTSQWLAEDTDQDVEDDIDFTAHEYYHLMALAILSHRSMIFIALVLCWSSSPLYRIYNTKRARAVVSRIFLELRVRIISMLFWRSVRAISLAWLIEWPFSLSV